MVKDLEQDSKKGMTEASHSTQKLKVKVNVVFFLWPEMTRCDFFYAVKSTHPQYNTQIKNARDMT